MGSRSTASVVAGMAVRSLRSRKGWSMEQLGAKVGLTRKGIWRIEQGGTTSVERLERIADALGVGLADLLPSGDSPQRT